LKWENGGVWYKADYTGYEGLAEYVISHLLQYSTLSEEEYVIYEPEEIKYRNQIFRGVKSDNFLDENWQIITLERLYKNAFNQSLYETIWKIHDAKERFEFLVTQSKRLTGIQDIGIYFAKLLTIDAVFLNEDRHMHNIAVLMNEDNQYKLCPIFDTGGGLLSDTTLDYPLDEDVYMLMGTVEPKTLSHSFDEQLDIAESFYQETIHFHFTKKDVDRILEKISGYSEKETRRLKNIIFAQMAKYSYLW
jgi:hypothetical protein